MKKITISIVALLAAALVFTLSAFACNEITQATAEEGTTVQAGNVYTGNNQWPNHHNQ